ncbi:MAG: phosphoribosylaminoimidazolesuccinocarboxamide synthase [Desulfocucumaceae bacterium]
MGKLVIDLSKCKVPDYNGSVQELYFPGDNPYHMICKTTSGGSVFDVGTIFNIPGSDISRTALRHKIYSLLGSKEEWAGVKEDISSMFKGNGEFVSFLREGVLEDYVLNGADTHHVGMIDRETGEVYTGCFPDTPSQYVIVKKYNIIKPKRVKLFLNNLWDYSEYHAADKYVVPLENIVRFGVVPGSSVYRKYKALDQKDRRAYLDELGLQEELVPWSPFSVPTVDFTTKYEPEDRNLSLQEALYVCGCGGGCLSNIFTMSILGALLVHRFFNRLGLFLWDLKWEIAKDGDKLVFVDTIDTDSLRATTRVNYKEKVYNVSINKQSMRDYYKIMHPRWFEAIREAKLAAAKSGKSFHIHLEEGQNKGHYPGTPVVDPNFISIQAEKFSTLISYIYDSSMAGEASEKLRETAKKEIVYYEANNALGEFFLINGAEA